MKPLAFRLTRRGLDQKASHPVLVPVSDLSVMCGPHTHIALPEGTSPVNPSVPWLLNTEFKLPPTNQIYGMTLKHVKTEMGSKILIRRPHGKRGVEKGGVAK